MFLNKIFKKKPKKGVEREAPKLSLPIDLSDVTPPTPTTLVDRSKERGVDSFMDEVFQSLDNYQLDVQRKDSKRQEQQEEEDLSDAAIAMRYLDFRATVEERLGKKTEPELLVEKPKTADKREDTWASKKTPSERTTLRTTGSGRKPTSVTTTTTLASATTVASSPPIQSSKPTGQSSIKRPTQTPAEQHQQQRLRRNLSSPNLVASASPIKNSNSYNDTRNFIRSHSKYPEAPVAVKPQVVPASYDFLRHPPMQRSATPPHYYQEHPHYYQEQPHYSSSYQQQHQQMMINRPQMPGFYGGGGSRSDYYNASSEAAYGRGYGSSEFYRGSGHRAGSDYMGSTSRSEYLGHQPQGLQFSGPSHRRRMQQIHAESDTESTGGGSTESEEARPVVVRTPGRTKGKQPTDTPNEALGKHANGSVSMPDLSAMTAVQKQQFMMAYYAQMTAFQQVSSGDLGPKTPSKKEKESNVKKKKKKSSGKHKKIHDEEHVEQKEEPHQTGDVQVEEQGHRREE